MHVARVFALVAIFPVVVHGTDFQYFADKAACTGAHSISHGSGSAEVRCLEIHRCVDSSSGEEVSLSVFRTLGHESVDLSTRGARRDWEEDAHYCENIFSSSVADIGTFLASWCLLQSGMEVSLNVMNRGQRCHYLDIDRMYVGEDTDCARGHASDNVVCVTTPDVEAMWASPEDTEPETTVSPTMAPSGENFGASVTTADPVVTTPVLGAGEGEVSSSSSGGGSESEASAVYFVAPTVVAALIGVGLFLKHRRPPAPAPPARNAPAVDLSFVNPDYRPEPLMQQEEEENQGYVYSAVRPKGDAGYYSAASSAEYQPLELQEGYDQQPAQAEYDLAMDTEAGASVLNAEPVYDVATGPPSLPEDEEGYLVPQPGTPDVEDFGV